jgi:hypothetical protein
MPSARGGRRRLWWILLWAAFAIALVGRATSRKPTRGVLLDHLEFGRRLVHGENVYAPWRSDADAPERPLHAPYPPSFGLLTAPFHLVDAAFGQRAARCAWALLQLAALVAIAWTLRALLQPTALAIDDAGRWQWLWLGTFVLTARFLLRDTHGGGGNLINVALALAAFAASERGRPGRGGALLAFSLVTKPTLVWLLPVFALFWRWRLLAATAVAAAALLLTTLLLQRFDIASWTRWWQGSLALALQSDPWQVPAFGFPPFEWMNQALRMCLARWAGEVPPEYAARVALGVAPGLGLGADAVAWIVRMTSVGLVLATLLVAARARTSAPARLWIIAATLVLALLLSPLSWKGHHVALVPVVLLLLHRIQHTRSRLLLALVLLWFAGCALPGGDLVGDDLDEWLNSSYVVTFGDLLLLAMALRQAMLSPAPATNDTAMTPGRD